MTPELVTGNYTNRLAGDAPSTSALVAVSNVDILERPPIGRTIGMAGTGVV
jgi:hypothetical protein